MLYYSMQSISSLEHNTTTSVATTVGGNVRESTKYYKESDCKTPSYSERKKNLSLANLGSRFFSAHFLYIHTYYIMNIIYIHTYRQTI